jgi:hypothetical protein
MKRMALLITALVGTVAAVRSWRTRKADAELWQEATRDLG